MSTGPHTRTLTRAHAHSHSRVHTHSHTLTRTHSLTHSHTLTLSHTYSLTHAHTHACTLTHTHLLTLSHTHSLTHSLTRLLTHTCTRPGKPGPGASVRQSETPSRPHVVNNPCTFPHGPGVLEGPVGAAANAWTGLPLGLLPGQRFPGTPRHSRCAGCGSSPLC